MKGALALRNPVGTPKQNANASVTIPAASYLELEASSDQSCSALLVFNTSSQPIKIATGAAASESDKFIVPPATIGMMIPIEIKKGTRISARSTGADATTGFFVYNKFV